MTFLESEESDILIGEAKISGDELTHIETFIYSNLESAFDSAANHIINFSEERKAELTRINETLIVEKVASLKKSYDLKIENSRRIISIVTDPNIIRMHQSHIRNLEDEKIDKIKLVEENRIVENSIEEIAAGVIKVI